MLKENYKNSCLKIAIAFLLFCLLILGLKYKTHYDINYFNSKVIAKAAEELAICQNDYYISYISFKDSFFKKELKIIDQIKTITNSQGISETVSVKFRNKNWGKKFKVDRATYDLINKGVGNPIYFDDLQELLGLELVETMINQSHEIPKKVGFVAIKHYFNIVYIFILTNTNEYNNQCQEKEFKLILNKMHSFTKQLNEDLF